MHICLYFHDYIEDSLEYSNGYKFTTKDQDNDGWSGGQCAQAYRGAWWYYNCHRSNLNGLYLDDSGYFCTYIFIFSMNNCNT